MLKSSESSTTDSNKSTDGNFQSFLIIDFSLFLSISISFSTTAFSIDKSSSSASPVKCSSTSCEGSSSTGSLSSVWFSSSTTSDTLSKNDSSSIIFEDSDTSFFGNKSLNDIELNPFLINAENEANTS